IQTQRGDADGHHHRRRRRRPRGPHRRHHPPLGPLRRHPRHQGSWPVGHRRRLPRLPHQPRHAGADHAHTGVRAHHRPRQPLPRLPAQVPPIAFGRYVAALTEGLELPPLTGTPKQIAWAEQLRARSLAGNWEDVERGLTDEGRVLNVVWEAGWWAPEPDEEEFGVEYPNWQQKLIPHEELARLRTLAEARAWSARVVAERTDAAWWIDPYRYGY